MNTNAHLDALDTLVDSRPMLDPANYGSIADYRADQRANMRDRADYWLLRRIAGTPTADELIEAARGSRIAFLPRVSMEHRICAPAPDGLQVAADYTASQYYPREYRAACVRLLAQCWWARTAAARPEWTSDDIRAHARRMFGRGIASRWFN